MPVKSGAIQLSGLSQNAKREDGKNWWSRKHAQSLQWVCRQREIFSATPSHLKHLICAYGLGGKGGGVICVTSLLRTIKFRIGEGRSAGGYQNTCETQPEGSSGHI